MQYFSFISLPHPQRLKNGSIGSPVIPIFQEASHFHLYLNCKSTPNTRSGYKPSKGSQIISINLKVEHYSMKLPIFITNNLLTAPIRLLLICICTSSAISQNSDQSMPKYPIRSSIFGCREHIFQLIPKCEQKGYRTKLRSRIVLCLRFGIIRNTYLTSSLLSVL